MRTLSLKEDKKIYILDTSALLTYIEDEEGYIAALCQELKGILVHKDPEFEKMSPPVKEFRLPYKTC